MTNRGRSRVGPKVLEAGAKKLRWGRVGPHKCVRRVEWCLGETPDLEKAAGQGPDADIICNLAFVPPAAPQRLIP